MRRAVLLPNPSASGFTGGAFRGVAAALAESFDVVASWADGPEDATRRAAKAAADGVDVAIAMGGDGVIHHVANGLTHTDTALGIIPAGTTNVLARILSLPRSSIAAAQEIGGYEAQDQTLALVTSGTDGPQARHAMFAMGVGFDADVVAVAERRQHSKQRLGSLHFARTAVAQVFGDYRHKVPALRVRCDGRTVEAVAVMIQVHDRYTYLGRIPMFLASDGGAGITAVAIADVGPKAAVSVIRHSVLKRSLEEAPGCVVFRDFSKLTIEADPATPYQADGEVLGTAGRLEVTPSPAALRILVPPLSAR